MAITKLTHMKESPGCPHDHLRNAIDYILDVKHNGEKTAGGQLVGGNSGTDHKEILENFLETKRDYGKTDGRQGYHFVISFAKGETDETTAYEVIKEFCEHYLGDDYDYVFAVHDDKAHMHGHIVFNSVSRTDGYKYHYKKGDWEKIIQPITDQICKEHDLKPLTYEEERCGVSYASWAAKQQGEIIWKDIICADVDYAIQRAHSYSEFKSILQKMNYRIREGNSVRFQEPYLAFAFISEDGTKHTHRSNSKYMKGYSKKEILERIHTKEGSRSYEEIVEQLSSQAADYLKKPAVLKSTQTYRRLYQAVSYYKLPNPFAVPQSQVRQDMLRLNRLIEDCRYLKMNQVGEIEQRSAQLETRLNELLAKRRKLYGIQKGMNKEQKACMEQYENLQKRLMQAGTADSHFEEIEDEMAELEELFPSELLETKSRIEDYSKEISAVRKEKRILERIQKTEGKDEVRTNDISYKK